jgi:hypothetical protein
MWVSIRTVLVCNTLDGAFDLTIHATPLKWEKIHEANLIHHAGKICLFIYQKSSNKCDNIPSLFSLSFSLYILYWCHYGTNKN